MLGEGQEVQFSSQNGHVWNGLSEEIVEADCIHIYKNKFDKYRYGDRI